MKIGKFSSTLRFQLEEPDPETAAWLAALSGDRSLFEAAWAGCQSKLDPEPGMLLDAEGQQIPVTWRSGMRGVWDYAADLCRPPLTTAALDFLYPIYYQGPLYGILPQLLLSGDQVWVDRVLTDYQHNPHLLVEALDDQEELVPRTKSYQLRIAVMMVCQRNDLEALRSLLPLLKVAPLPNAFDMSTVILSLLGASCPMLELFLETYPEYAYKVFNVALSHGNYSQGMELALAHLRPDICPLTEEQLREIFFRLVFKQHFRQALTLAELYQATPEALDFSLCLFLQITAWPTREADLARLLEEAQTRGWTERLEALQAGIAKPRPAHFW